MSSQRKAHTRARGSGAVYISISQIARSIAHHSTAVCCTSSAPPSRPQWTQCPGSERRAPRRLRVSACWSATGITSGSNSTCRVGTLSKCLRIVQHIAGDRIPFRIRAHDLGLSQPVLIQLLPQLQHVGLRIRSLVPGSLQDQQQEARLLQGFTRAEEGSCICVPQANVVNR